MPREHSIPTVTLQLLPGAVATAMAQLVTWCVQESYAFLQSWHDDGHTEVEIRNQHQQVLVHLVLHRLQAETLAPVAVVLPSVDTLPPESAALVQRLLRLGMVF